MSDFLLAEAHRIRLRVLQYLSKQPGDTSSVALIEAELRRLGYTKSGSYVLNQLRWLETEALAVRMIDDVAVRLLDAGRQHVAGTRQLTNVDSAPEVT